MSTNPYFPSSVRADGKRPDASGLLAPVATVLELLHKIPDSLIALFARIGIAAVFFKSGQTKLTDPFAIWEMPWAIFGDWRISDSAIFLFTDVHPVPLLPVEFAATLAAIVELTVPFFLVLGLGTRACAFVFFGMTIVIQIVLPSAWPSHAIWAAALVFLIARGPGVVSLDHLIAGRFLGRTKA